MKPKQFCLFQPVLSLTVYIIMDLTDIIFEKHQQNYRMAYVFNKIILDIYIILHNCIIQ